MKTEKLIPFVKLKKNQLSSKRDTDKVFVKHLILRECIRATM